MSEADAVDWEALGALSDDWDGYGGLPPTAEAIEGAQKAHLFLSALVPEVDVTPTTNGCLDLDFEDGDTVMQVMVGRTRLSAYGQSADCGFRFNGNWGDDDAFNDFTAKAQAFLNREAS